MLQTFLEMSSLDFLPSAGFLATQEVAPISRVCQNDFFIYIILTSVFFQNLCCTRGGPEIFFGAGFVSALIR